MFNNQWINSYFLLCRFDELTKKFNVEYHAGGATQNSVKIAQVGPTHEHYFLCEDFIGQCKSKLFG